MFDKTHPAKKLAAAISLMLVALFLLSALYIIGHSGHECLGESCGICLRLEITRSLLSQFAGAALAASALCFLNVPCCRLYIKSRVQAACGSLISNHVQMNN
jgi:hypothetical protein